MKSGKYFIPLVLLVLCSSTAFATPVSYVAELFTTKKLPVTDVLILEQDDNDVVHATIYNGKVPGNGLATITHEPEFTPVKSLIIGITDGLTPKGEDKIQIIMFLDTDFASSIQGEKWSLVFPGTRHSVTIEKILAASGGDQEALEWFTKIFFKEVGNQAVFDTGKGFSVGEFSAFDQIGSAVTFGNWVLTAPIELLPTGADGTINGFPTALINESATDEGPFDIQFSFDNTGTFGVDKTVTNSTDHVWVRFVMKVGIGMGGEFSQSSCCGEPEFVNFMVSETTGAFPDSQFGIYEIVFSGMLMPGETAHFTVLTNVLSNAKPITATIRQEVIVDEVFSDSYEDL